MNISRFKLKEGHSTDLRFSSFQLFQREYTHPLYPYNSKDLAVLFVYGADFERQMNIVFIPESVQTLIILISLFMILVAVILRIIRRKFNLPRQSLLSIILDIAIAFIGGGNLRMHHKYERLLFGILLIAAFLITSIFTGELLDCIYSVMNQKIDTFEQLAERNQSVYISPALKSHVPLICEVLR